MFNLIITIIAIILVAAVTGASVYYGGKAFNKSGADADAAAFINGSQQIAAAFTLATAESKTLLGGNFTEYLASVPSVKGIQLLAGADGTTAPTFATNVSSDGYLLIKTNADICSAIAKKTSANGTEAPTTGALSGLYNCVENAAVVDAAKAISIPTDVTGDYYFGYKVK